MESEQTDGTLALEPEVEVLHVAKEGIKIRIASEEAVVEKLKSELYSTMGKISLLKELLNKEKENAV